MTTVLNFITNYDDRLFHFINRVWTHPFLDQLMPFLTNFNRTKFILIGFAIALLLIYRFNGLRIILACGFAVLISDVTAAQIIKPLVHRQRPQFVDTQTRLLVPSQSSPSFPSNHAANSAAAATVISFAIPVIGGFAWLIAFLIAYSRIYVGVHFPLDVLGGIFLGVIAGSIALNVMWMLGLNYADEAPLKGHWKRRQFYKKRKVKKKLS